MEKEVVTNEELAVMINKGFNNLESRLESRFDSVETRLEGVETHLDQVDTRPDHVDARLGRIEADIKELTGVIVYRHEFEDVLGRVKYLEKKMGIESGK